MRKRRTLEGAAFVARGLGLVCTLIFLAGALGPASEHVPPTLRTSCILGVFLMVCGNVVAAINFRRPTGPRYSAYSAIQVGIDTSTVMGIVVWAQGYSGQTAWPLLMIAIVVGAYRHRLAGSLVVWSVTSAGFVVAMNVIPSPALRTGELPMCLMVGLIVAVLSGIQGEAFARQVRELELARRAMQHQAHHDGLTGLPNREQVDAYAAAQRGRSLAVLVLDLNGFKLVNDVRGHAVGDRLLQEVSHRLATGLREGDLAGRIGGDEFIVLMPGADEHTAAELADRLRDDIRRPVVIDGDEVAVGTSIGIACRPAGSSRTLDDLTRDADTAMYEDKALSRT
ncbi:GGDEF domain-containing protein [Actinoplanes sp. NPDC026619]|uniref:GGDEF domain-containing protein n=1 Tax=Actinoplanes sp. NPDC026619 TaxID=3155798 RepID=UPI003401EAC5